MAVHRRVDRLRGRADAMAQRWSRRRQGPDNLPVTLTARRIYILPTRAGIAFAVMVLAILAAGLNYGNGLVLIVGFLLAGFALTGLHQCHRRLLGLVVQDLVLHPGFVGGQLGIQLRLGAMPGPAAGEYHLSLRPTGESPLCTHATSDDVLIGFTLRPAATRRGRWKLPPLKIDCDAPAGLFRSWVWLHLDAGTLVYPSPLGTQPLPGAPEGNGQVAAEVAGHDEWVGLRPFREGDSPRQVAWKAYARGAPLLSREWHGLEGRTHVFDYGRLAGGDAETRLSQLAAWILEAERRQEPWSLVLPARQLPAGLGPSQASEGLSILALHGLPQDRTP